jgi:hypothetical protein
MNLTIDKIINPDDREYADVLWAIALSPIGSVFGVYGKHNDIQDALEVLGAWCADNAPGYIVDASNFSEEELDEASLLFVNGALDCALDLHECMHYMVEEQAI